MIAYHAIVLLIATLTTTTFFPFVKAVTPADRANHECVILQSTIYCYGGAPRVPTEAISIVSHTTGLFYTLDLSQEKSVSDLETSWVEYTGQNVGPNNYFAMVAIPGENSFIIDGGRGGGGQTGPFIKNSTVIFNATGDGQFSTIRDGNHSVVDSHCGVYDPASNQAFFYGGRKSYEYSGLLGSEGFPDTMPIFDVFRSTWSLSRSTLRKLTQETRVNHKGVLGNDGNTIYYIGGIYPSAENPDGSVEYQYASMTQILTYNIQESTWGLETTSGLVPSSRIDHSLTLKPSTGEIVVYGGSPMGSGIPVPDYFYILDPGNMVWSNRSINASDDAQGAGARFGHAAVRAGNDTLFIIFGSTGQSDSSIHVLDIGSWSWVNKIVGFGSNGQPNTPPGGITPNDPSSDTSSGVSSGTIAGAVVGAVVGVCFF
ncbi:hypothetical protein BDA99DRAFT_311242 [Phascolomyces articulosus]|uniref:Galactose oxidase n=1 Tax=Phascolomyces articulosus TaxID=60185 RepID=A0AAD5JLR7_9FUNG|nr:hypothetical protein BDA99DRAFT_311242 [Phascolomyces articulosus]